MRKFYIQNQYGEKIELQGGSIFFWEPEGLGYENSIDYMETDGFFIETHREQVQLNKSGTLVFFPTQAYKNYREFANWVLAAQSLTLAYNPDGEWYFMDVDITQMEKSELTLYRTLEIPVQFTPLSPWYAPYDMNLIIEGINTDNVKLYDYRYPYRYTSSARAGVLDFTVTAQLPCDFEINMEGPIQNPVITAQRLDTGSVIGKIDLSAVSADVDETIRFTTVPNRAGASLVTADGTQDLTAQLGINEDVPTFFRIPVNIPVEFQLTATSLLGVSVALKIYRYYRTV